MDQRRKAASWIRRPPCMLATLVCNHKKGPRKQSEDVPDGRPSTVLHQFRGPCTIAWENADEPREKLQPREDRGVEKTCVPINFQTPIETEACPVCRIYFMWPAEDLVSRGGMSSADRSEPASAHNVPQSGSPSAVQPPTQSPSLPPEPFPFPAPLPSRLRHLQHPKLPRSQISPQ